MSYSESMHFASATLEDLESDDLAEVFLLHAGKCALATSNVSVEGLFECLANVPQKLKKLPFFRLKEAELATMQRQPKKAAATYMAVFKQNPMLRFGLNGMFNSIVLQEGQFAAVEFLKSLNFTEDQITELINLGHGVHEGDALSSAYAPEVFDSVESLSRALLEDPENLSLSDKIQQLRSAGLTEGVVKSPTILEAESVRKLRHERYLLEFRLRRATSKPR